MVTQSPCLSLSSSRVYPHEHSALIARFLIKKKKQTAECGATLPNTEPSSPWAGFTVFPLSSEVITLTQAFVVLSLFGRLYRLVFCELFGSILWCVLVSFCCCDRNQLRGRKGPRRGSTQRLWPGNSFTEGSTEERGLLAQSQAHA